MSTNNRTMVLLYSALLLLALTLVGAVPSTQPQLQPRQQHDHHQMHDDDPASGISGAADVVPPSSIDTLLPSATASAAHSHASPTYPDTPPDPHAHHNSHEPAKTVLDDDEIHHWHHFPPSYLAADFRLDESTAIFGEEFDEEWDPDEAGGHKGLVFMHAGLFLVAYFVVLPITLALRAADHPSHYLANAAFLTVAVLAWVAGAAYKAATPDRYEGSSYGLLLSILLLLSLSLAAIDSISLMSRAASLWRAGERSLPAIFREVVRPNSQRWLDDAHHHASRYEMIGLVEHEHGDDDNEQEHDAHRVVFTVGDDEDEDAIATVDEHKRTLASSTPSERPRRPSLLIRRYTPPSRTSTGSDGTLHDLPHSPSGPHAHKPAVSRMGAYDQHVDEQQHQWVDMRGEVEEESKKMTARRFGEIALTWVRRSQLVLAYVTTLVGIVTYTGQCRSTLLPSCLAHYIKGSIFFGYGVLTFARYLGAYADLGWAWNRRPDGKRGVSAEMVESSVVFAYGITNTWLERIGAHAGDPYTVKQVQHISIAVMFWFAGLSGILLESRHVRKLLGAVVLGKDADAVEPATYAFSFNPFPALVIAVTGLAMAAHHQTYVFQVQIHTLWGLLLAGGSVFRFLTYIFLHLRPPVESVFPSRPPTEVLSSFGWAAGGIVFMLSGEEYAWAALRAGWDDMMAFLCFTVALTCLTFCWVAVVLAIKGWAVLRVRKALQAARHGEGSA